MEGWVKFHREWINNPYIAKDGEHLAIWMYLMLNATHTEMQAQFGKEIITLKSGQLLTSYREIEERLKINRCKVNRVFEWLKKGTLIETAIGSTKTLVTISVWQDSQAIGETQNETEVRHNRDTKQDREKEKEKRSKREKEKEKEKNKNEKNEIIYTPLYPPEEELFERFWTKYPKKIGKGYARQCFNRLKPSSSLVDTMLKAIEEQKKSEMWKRDKGQYIPNPSTWLNQRRWEDDLNVDTNEDNPWKNFDLGITL